MAVGKFLDELANTLTVAGISRTADYFGVFDSSADSGNGEHAKVIASEILDRLLSSGVISWMTALSLTSIVGADDKFLVWDASAPGWRVVTASELLDKTFAGTSVSGISTISLLSGVDGTADYLAFFDASAGVWKKIRVGLITEYLAFQYAGAITSTPYAVTSLYAGKRLSNLGATQVVTFTLPAATIYARYSFQRVANYAIRLDPNGSETIGDGGAGKYLEITGRGAVDIECLSAGSWEVTGGSAVYSFEY